MNGKRAMLRFLFSNGMNVLLGVLLVVAIFSQLYRREYYLDLFLSSDSLYLPSLYRDLIMDQNSISGWHLNPAPNFFPDMLFYFILNFLTGNFLWATFLFAVVQFLVAIALLMALIRFFVPHLNSAYKRALYVGMSFFCLEAFFFTEDMVYAFILLINSYHTGAFISALFCLLITLKYFRKPGKWQLPVLFLIILFCTLSDRLFLVTFVMPVVATCVLLWKKLGLKNVLWLNSIVVVAAVMGVFIFFKIDRTTYRVFTENVWLNMPAIAGSFERLMGHMKMFLIDLGFRWITVCFFIISFILTIVLFFRAYRKQEIHLAFYTAFCTIFTVVVFFAPVLSGRYLGNDCIRYNVYPVFFGFANCILFFAYFRNTAIPNKFWKYSIYSLFFIVFLTTLFMIRVQGLNRYFTLYPDVVRQIDNYAEKEKLLNGVGNHWISKKVTMFSKKGVRIRSVFDDCSIYDHVGNDQWFFNNIFTFVVTNNFGDTTIYDTHLKNLKAIEYSDSLRMFKADSFTYNRSIGYKPINLR